MYWTSQLLHAQYDRNSVTADWSTNSSQDMIGSTIYKVGRLEEQSNVYHIAKTVTRSSTSCAVLLYIHVCSCRFASKPSKYRNSRVPRNCHWGPALALSQPGSHQRHVGASLALVFFVGVPNSWRNLRYASCDSMVSTNRYSVLLGQQRVPVTVAERYSQLQNSTDHQYRSSVPIMSRHL